MTLPRAALASTLAKSLAPVRGTTSDGPGHRLADTHRPRALAVGTLQIAAQVLDDLERVRIAQENRVRSLTRTEVDKDGQLRGLGYDGNDPEVIALTMTLGGLMNLEHQSTLQLQRILRKHPLGAWVKATKGIGEKQGARLLASVGDPYWNDLHDRPRTVSQLWAYAGYHVLAAGQRTPDTHAVDASGNLSPIGQGLLGAHVSNAGGGASSGHPDHRTSDTQTAAVGVAAKRRKGVKSNWSSDAKMRVFLCAKSCLRQIHGTCRDQLRESKQDGAKWAKHPEVCACSPYRVTYDERRMHTATTHPEWSDGHSHNDGLRIAAKAILRDLWIAARDLHAVAE
jgi:hypothetical protein